MKRTAIFRFEDVSVRAELANTATADAIWNALPIQSKTSTWGAEVYFSAGVSATPEPDARDVVDAGELAYWLAGDAIAIAFGRTPISVGDEIRLASDCNIWGRLTDAPGQLSKVRAGETVTLEKLSDT